MAFIPVANVAQLEYIYSWDGQTVQNVVHYRFTVTPDAEDLQHLTTAAIAWWTTSLRSTVTSVAQLVTVRATDLTTQEGPVIEDTTTLPLAGTASSATLPNNVTVAIKLITASRGRSYRGRVYHIGLGGNAVVGNVISTATRTSLRNAWTAALTLGTVPASRLVVASKYTNNAPRINGLSTLVTDISINSTVDSQRRRLPERGR